MNCKIVVILVVGILALSNVSSGQSSGSDGQGQNYGRGNGGDDRDLASSIGVDRDALYEELLRMQEEMGSADGQGSPPEIPEGLEGPEGQGGPEGPEDQGSAEGQGSSDGDGSYGGEGQGDQGGQEEGAEPGQGGLGQGYGGLDDGTSEY